MQGPSKDKPRLLQDKPMELRREPSGQDTMKKAGNRYKVMHADVDEA